MRKHPIVHFAVAAIFFACVAYYDRFGGSVFARNIIFGSRSFVGLRSEEKHSSIVKWEVQIAALFTNATMTEDLKTSE